MGNSKSEEYGSLVRNWQRSQWSVLEERGLYSIWMHKATATRYMVYSVDVQQIQSSQRLEMYAFRKQNNCCLVTVQCILVDRETKLCESPKNAYLVVEYIPERLDAFKNALGFQQALIVLKNVLSAYSILNFIYGPLYTSSEMICLNQKGRPKVWLNQNLSLNQPSLKAQGQLIVPQSSRKLAKTPHAKRQCASKIYNYLVNIFRTVEGACISKFPVDLTSAIERMQSFQEAEEFIAQYCGAKHIQIGECISMQKMNKDNNNVVLDHDRIMRTVNSRNPNYYELNSILSTNKSQKRVLFSPKTMASPISKLQYLKIRNISGLKSEPTLRTTGGSRANIKIKYCQNSGMGVKQIGPICQFPRLLKESEARKSQSDCSQKNLQYQRGVSNLSESVQNNAAEQDQLTQMINPKQMGIGRQKRSPFVMENVCAPKIEQRTSLFLNEHQQMVNPLSEASYIEQGPKLCLSKLQKDNCAGDYLQSDSSVLLESKNRAKTLQELRLWEESLSKLSQKQISSSEVKEENLAERLEEKEDQNSVQIEKTSSIYEMTNQQDLEEYIRSKYSSYLTGNDVKLVRSTFYRNNDRSRFDYPDSACEPEKYLNLRNNSSDKLLQSIAEEDNEDHNQGGWVIRLIPVPIINERSIHHTRRVSLAANRDSDLSVKMVDNPVQVVTTEYRPVKKDRDVARDKIEERYEKYVKNRVPLAAASKAITLTSVNEVQKEIFNSSFGKGSKTPQNSQFRQQKSLTILGPKLASLNPNMQKASKSQWDSKKGVRGDKFVRKW